MKKRVLKLCIFLFSLLMLFNNFAIKAQSTKNTTSNVKSTEIPVTPNTNLPAKPDNNQAVDNDKSKKLEQNSQKEIVVTPTPTISVTPIAAETKGDENIKLDSDYHSNTNPFIANKLLLGVSLSAGFGSNSIIDEKSDHLGYSFFIGYVTYPFIYLDDTDIITTLKYITWTGTKDNTNLNFIAQAMLIGGGLNYLLPQNNNIFLYAGLYLGLVKHKYVSGSVYDFETYSPSYNFSSSLDFKTSYKFLDKLETFVGFNLVLGQNSWYDINIGMLAYF